MYTDDESRVAYIQLQTLLLRSELSWVIPQIQAEIAKGKITLKSIKDISRMPDLTLFETNELERVRRSSKDQVLTSQAYTNKEQLVILLNALAEITDINVIRKEIINNLKEIDQGITSVEFASEESEEPNILIDENETETTDNTFNDLTRLINEIKSNL